MKAFFYIIAKYVFWITAFFDKLLPKKEILVALWLLLKKLCKNDDNDDDDDDDNDDEDYGDYDDDD